MLLIYLYPLWFALTYCGLSPPKIKTDAVNDLIQGSYARSLQSYSQKPGQALEFTALFKPTQYENNAWSAFGIQFERETPIMDNNLANYIHL